ncbi:MAG: RNA polymerase subunit sigma-70 [Firmicutes bacterium]|nr:RNA polymerase subunit sigma-70 [Bacillota bacterium]
MHRRVDGSLLYDLYGALLTERQRQIWQLYWQEDWSLAEISRAVGVSRAAIYDALERSWEQLDAYDRKLGLLAEHRRRVEALQRLKAALDQAPAEAGWRQEAMAAWAALAREEGLEERGEEGSDV